MPKTRAQTASTMDKIEQTVFDAGVSFKRTLANHNFFGFITALHPFLLKLHIIDGRRFFGIHLFGSINAFLLEYDRFDHNGQETDNARKKQSTTGFSFKSFKSIGIRCRNKEVREDKGCACYPNHGG